MLEAIFFSLWFFAPAGFANLAAFASGKIGFLKKYNFPADFYIKIKGKRLLGSHKTIRGFISAILFGIIICSFEKGGYNLFFTIRELIPLDYYTINPIILGGLLGFGALAGDSIKSLFKRLRSIPPGESWFPFDQIDYIIGGIAFSLFYIQLSLGMYVVLFIIWFLMHPLISFIGYLFRLRHNPI